VRRCSDRSPAKGIITGIATEIAIPLCIGQDLPLAGWVGALRRRTSCLARTRGLAIGRRGGSVHGSVQSAVAVLNGSLVAEFA